MNFKSNFMQNILVDEEKIVVEQVIMMCYTVKNKISKRNERREP